MKLNLKKLNCEPLIKAIDAYIEKADNDLTDALGDAGFVDARETVEEISRLEERVARTLKRETRQILDAAEAADDLDTFANSVWPEVKLADDTDIRLSRVFFDEFNVTVPPLVSRYVKSIDADLIVTDITKRTTAWARDWSRQLGELMKLNTHEQIENLLVTSLKEGHGVAEFTRALMDSKIREEYYC